MKLRESMMLCEEDEKVDDVEGTKMSRKTRKWMVSRITMFSRTSTTTPQ